MGKLCLLVYKNWISNLHFKGSLYFLKGPIYFPKMKPIVFMPCGIKSLSTNDNNIQRLYISKQYGLINYSKDISCFLPKVIVDEAGMMP